MKTNGEIMMTTRIQILNELKQQNTQSPIQLKTKLGKHVSSMLGRMHKDKEIQRNLNPNHGNDIRYSITQKGINQLNYYINNRVLL